MGIKEGGNMAILAGVGPMGLGAIDFAINNERKPKLLVVTDINQKGLTVQLPFIPWKMQPAKESSWYTSTHPHRIRRDYLMSLPTAKVMTMYSYSPVKQVIEMAISCWAMTDV